MLLAAYLPIDRLIALAQGAAFPEHSRGAALFADLSGFTPLTEALVRALGEEHAAEALTDALNTVFDALISQIHHYGGTVISFAGDAITCWFDDRRPSQDGAPGVARAAVCALALQEAMGGFADLRAAGELVDLSLKVVVAAGEAQRFLVGDPQIQLFDLLVGSPVDRLAPGEALAARSEALLDEDAVAALGPIAEFGPPRTDAQGWRFHRLQRLDPTPAPAPWPALPPDALEPAMLRPWLLSDVADRLAADATFLAELRPATTLFLRFSAHDYATDPEAVAQLDAYIRAAQRALDQHGGAIHQIIVGDKGCYLYAACGAPIAYEDNAARAASAALKLRGLQVGPVRTRQIGVAGGRVRAGAYGAQVRRTYGVIGDAVNLAARLMGRAAGGEILIDGRTQGGIGEAFIVEPRPPLPLKGRAEPLPVFALERRVQLRAARLPEPSYTLPMVGREAELEQIAALLDRAHAGQGQVIAIIGEAGIGKSRLLAEIVRLARRRGGAGYGGAASASEQQTAYLVWRPVFQALLGVDPELPLRRQIRWLESELEERAPERVELLPLLGPLLELPLPENDVTAAMDARTRKGALEALLLELLESAAQDAGGGTGVLLVMLEDLHWLDSLSADLLTLAARAAQRLPLLLLLASRPVEGGGLPPAVTELGHATVILLAALGETALDGLARAKLAQLYPARAEAPPPELLARLATRSQGNPFYAEELLNYLRDRGVDPYDTQALDALALPDTLHRLILARIDQLTAAERTTLRVASVVGRSFPAAWLPNYAPEVGTLERVRADLERLARLDLTPLEQPEPELTYLFKHIVTQEVAYSSLPLRMRQRLHTQLARWLEAHFPDAPPLDLLAFHYDRGDDDAMRRSSLRRAGDAARAAYANAAAADYYTRLLALGLEPAARAELLLLLGVAQFELGQFTAAQATFAQAAEVASATGDQHSEAEALSRQGRVLAEMGDYARAIAAQESALALARQLGDTLGQLRAARYLSALAMWRNDGTNVHELLTTSLAQAQALGAHDAELSIRVNLGVKMLMDGDFHASEAHYQAALALAEQLGDRWHQALVLANLGEAVARQGRLEEARALSRRSLAADRAIGNHAGAALTLVNLADLACADSDPAEAQRLLREALPLSLLGGGAFIPLCVLYVTARVQLLRGASEPASALLRLALLHPASNEELRTQARDLAAEHGLNLDTSAQTLEAALASAERWLRAQ